LEHLVVPPGSLAASNQPAGAARRTPTAAEVHRILPVACRIRGEAFVEGVKDEPRRSLRDREPCDESVVDLDVALLVPSARYSYRLVHDR
jgi:hypothetical protein